jgi:hypothetical protein
MLVGVQGTKKFNDYPVFLRAMGTAMSMRNPDDKEIIVYAFGPYQINAMAQEFVNVTERSLKARGIRIKLYKMSHGWAKKNITKFSYFAFFSKPKEPVSEIVEVADAKNIDVGVYRY